MDCKVVSIRHPQLRDPSRSVDLEDFSNSEFRKVVTSCVLYPVGCFRQTISWPHITRTDIGQVLYVHCKIVNYNFFNFSTAENLSPAKQVMNLLEYTLMESPMLHYK